MVCSGATIPPCRLLLARWIMQTCITRHRAGADDSQASAENDLRNRRRSRSARLRLSGAAVFGVLYSSVYKVAARVADLGAEIAVDEAISAAYDRRAVAKLVKQLDEERKAAVEQLKHAAYFHRQVAWLQDRFPNVELQAVPGLVKLVDRKEIEAADWSLTPGRYVGVAPPEEDENFDFEQTLRDIHIELADLNKEAVELAAKIETNFEVLM